MWTLTAVAGLIVAAIGGAAIGLERQWSGHASGPHARFAGIRTFTLLGGLAGIAGWMVTSGQLLPGTVLLAAAAAIVVTGYAAASRAEIDGTTEVAALVVLAAGTLAGSGSLAVASAIIAATALLLVEKTRVHALASRVDAASMRASARFAAMACIVLPLLPAGPYGPYDAIRPRELWALVLFFSGLSFLGWLARRAVGADVGLVVSGLLGGIVSSTSVTLYHARQSRTTPAHGLALAGGAIGACTVMLLRVLLACAVLNPRLAAELPRLLWAPFVIGAAALAAILVAGNGQTGRDGVPESPLHLAGALQMALLFQLVLFAILYVQARWSAQALVGTAVFVGLTDLDALTLSLARGAGGAADPGPAAFALAAGVAANTVLKLATAATVGRGTFRLWTATVLGTMAIALLIALRSA